MTAIDGECEYDGQIKNNDLTYTREEDKYAQGIGGDTRTIFGKEYRSLSSALCNFLNSPVTSSLLGPNTLLNTPFSNTLSLRSSLNVSDQVSHPYRTMGNIKVLYIHTTYIVCYFPLHVINTGEYIFVLDVQWNPNGPSKYMRFPTTLYLRLLPPHVVFVSNFSAVIRHLPGTETESVKSFDNNIVKVQGVLFISGH